MYRVIGKFYRLIEEAYKLFICMFRPLLRSTGNDGSVERGQSLGEARKQGRLNYEAKRDSCCRK